MGTLGTERGMFSGGKQHCMVESVNEGWNNSIPVTKPRPQPDNAVGFRRPFLLILFQGRILYALLVPNVRSGVRLN
jgi:hypothetical protein